MKYLGQLILILALSFIGELLHAVVPLPIPAGIYGIVLLFLLLECKIIPLAAVKEAGSFLTGIMQLLFIPAAVGLMRTWPLIRADWLKYLAVILLSTFAVLAVSGRVTQAVMRRKSEKERGHDA